MTLQEAAQVGRLATGARMHRIRLHSVSSSSCSFWISSVVVSGVVRLSAVGIASLLARTLCHPRHLQQYRTQMATALSACQVLVRGLDNR